MPKQKSISTATRKSRYNYISVRVDEHIEEALRKYALNQRRSVPLTAGLLIEEALSAALNIEQKPSLNMA